MGWILLAFFLAAAVLVGAVVIAAASGRLHADGSDANLDRDEEFGEDEAPEPASKGPRDWSRDGFTLRRTLLTPAEQDFHRALVRAVDGGALIMAQVALEAVVRARRGAPAGVRGRLRRTVDFVLCDPASTAPRLVIELDDSSHRQRSRQQRDASIEQILASARLPLLRVAWARQYDPADLRQRIHAACGIASVPAPPGSRAPARPAASPAASAAMSSAPAQAEAGVATPLPAPTVTPLPVAANAEPRPASIADSVRTVGQPSNAGRRVGVAASPRPPAT